VEARHGKLPPEFRQRRSIPVSVKTRIGYDACQVREWIPQLLESEPVAISIHGRTLTQMYSGQSDWDAIGEAARIAAGTKTLILGNGDIASMADARRRVREYGVDGALIGRASYGNPYVFRDEEDAPTRGWDRRRYEILQIALEHARLYEESFGQLERYHFLPMRKHLGWYVRHLPGASHLRRTLTQSSSLGEAVAAIENYLAYRQGWEQ
jgi:tRNA-dihydrouridine synthase B